MLRSVAFEAFDRFAARLRPRVNCYRLCFVAQLLQVATDTTLASAVLMACSFGEIACHNQAIDC
jgi:hypothetical protein